MQRIGDHRRVQHVLDGDDLLEHRVRIVLRVMRGRDLDPGELLAGGAVIMHVPQRAHAVGIVGGRSISRLEIRLGAGRTRRRGTGARLARQRHQRDRALARRDGFGRVAKMDDVGAAAGLGRIDVAHAQAEIIHHRPGAARCIARAKVAIDIGAGQPGVLQRALRHFGVQLRGRLVGRMPRRVFVDSGDVRLALDAQTTLRWCFGPSGFFEPRPGDWQAPTAPAIPPCEIEGDEMAQHMGVCEIEGASQHQENGRDRESRC